MTAAWKASTSPSSGTVATPTITKCCGDAQARPCGSAAGEVDAWLPTAIAMDPTGALQRTEATPFTVNESVLMLGRGVCIPGMSQLNVVDGSMNTAPSTTCDG
jgi:hypothetical protein